jgi:D-glycero-alpha-D-manno-heptose-7-phosphate kinase
MIVTRTPFRISIGGGGTDLPSYYSKYGGFFISAAIDKYMYLMVQRPFTKEIHLKYAETERVKDVGKIKHPIVREVLRNHFNTNDGFEMSVSADIPAGTGLGSSGSFVTGLLKSVHALDNKIILPGQLAEDASDIVMNKLKRPDGKQDQYVAAYGGINSYTVDVDGTVDVEPLAISRETLDTLRDRLVLFFTGFYRQSETILGEQKKKSESEDKKMIEGLHYIKDLGKKIKDVLENEKPDEFGEIMLEHWEHKKTRAKNMSNSLINKWYDVALKNGAIGGKVIGAGGGGFLMFYAEDREKLVSTLMKEGLTRVRFDFDFEGAKSLVADQ